MDESEMEVRDGMERQIDVTRRSDLYERGQWMRCGKMICGVRKDR